MPDHDLSDANVLLVGYGGRESALINGYLERAGVAGCANALTAFSNEPPLDSALAALNGPPDLVFVNAKPGLHFCRTAVAQLGDFDTARGKPVILTAYHGAVSTLSAGDLDREHMTLQAALTCPLKLRRIWHMVAVALGKAEIGDFALGEEEEVITYVPPDLEIAHQHNAAILVAEDNETNQIVIRRILSRLGFAHEIANNGAEALDLYKIHPYGMLLTDFHMPEMDGFELTAAIRGLESETGTDTPLPIVALTADALPQTEQQCLDAGMNGYLRKPIELAKLEAALQQHMAHALDLRTVAVEEQADAEKTPVMPKVDPDVFDTSRLEDSFGEFDASAAEFVNDFLGSLERRIGELTDAMTREQSKEARDIAHALKGSASSIGATRVGQLMGDIQDMLDAQDPATAMLFVEVLPDAYAELRGEVGPLCDHFLG